MSTPRDRKEPYTWDPAEGMTPEERLGFELISTLEGRLVTDDTFRAYTRALGQTIRTMKRQLVWTRWVAGALIALAIALGLWGKASADEARDAAECNALRLEVLTTRVIPAHDTGGCDMTTVRVIVQRAIDNARSQAELEKRVASLERK